MRQKTSLILFSVIVFFGLIFHVSAANMSMSASATTVTVGSTVRINLRCDSLMGTFTVSSSDQSILSPKDYYGFCDENSFSDGLSQSLIFTAKKPGTVNVLYSTNNVTEKVETSSGISFNDYSSSRSIKITVVNKNTPSSIDVNRTYSKNNYLKSLSIEGYDLTPNFDKDTLEYSVTLEPGTESINVIATKEDSDASVKGNGEVSVSEGINTINVTVTAENGNERTYVIKANVEEKDPIEVKVNNKKYRVVKKKDLIGSKSGYTETTVNIKNIDIPALYNEVTKVTLVGLKDSEGNINLFAYNPSNGKYSEYKEFTFDLMNLYIHQKKKSKYTEVIIKINDVDVPAYKIKGIDEYYLLYATNTSTGYEGYYLYDTKENSVQRYDTTLLENLTKEKDKYLSIVIILSVVCFLSMLFLLIQINKDNKIKNEG